MNKMVSIDSIMDIYDTRFMWYPLGDYYRGYEYSNTGLLRSMKFKNRFPFGVLIKPNKDGVYELSNSYNERKKVTTAEILEMIKGQTPIYTFQRNQLTRNPLITSRSTTMKYKQKAKEFDKTPKPAHFNIIKTDF